MGYSSDKMLPGRLISYPDAHRYRLGVNYESLPVNCPRCPVHTYNRDGAMRFDDNGGDSPKYEPNSFGGPVQDRRRVEFPYKVSGDVARCDHRAGNDHYTQAGNLFRLLPEDERSRLVHNIASAMKGIPERLIHLQFEHFTKADPNYGRRIAEALNVGVGTPAVVGVK
jgi:catalase